MTAPSDTPSERPAAEAAHWDDPARWIVAIARDADHGRFIALFLHFAPKAKRYFLRFGLSDEAAEDLAQETLLTIWRKAALFDPSKASAEGWIFTIARNLSIDALRRNRRPAVPEVEVAEEPPMTPEQALRSRQGAVRLHAALSGLPDEQAEVLRLAFLEDQSHSVIAARLSLPLGTVKSRIRLATAALRIVLDDLA